MGCFWSSGKSWWWDENPLQCTQTTWHCGPWGKAFWHKFLLSNRKKGRKIGEKASTNSRNRWKFEKKTKKRRAPCGPGHWSMDPSAPPERRHWIGNHANKQPSVGSVEASDTRNLTAPLVVFCPAVGNWGFSKILRKKPAVKLSTLHFSLTIPYHSFSLLVAESITGALQQKTAGVFLGSKYTKSNKKATSETSGCA